MSLYASIRRGSPVCFLFGCGVLLLPAAGCHHSRLPVPDAPAVETVDVGYATQLRRDVTGAVVSLSPEKTADMKVSHVQELLEGRVAGLHVVRRPNGEFSLRIRGGRGEPLIVVNGIPSPPGLLNPLQDLAPGSVASITVLKDAGSTAAYGARGANGVILIRTRRGR